MDYTQLVYKCQKNNRKAQQELYSVFKNKMMGICLRYAAQKDEADDIFQEAFIKIFNKIGTLREPEKLEKWVRQIIINTAINHYHQQRNSRLAVDPAFISDVSEANQEYVEIIDQLNTRDLLDLVNALPDGYRMVFNLYVLDGYTHQEIADMLQISVGTSKSQLHGAKSLLKRQLEKIGIYKYEKAQ